MKDKIIEKQAELIAHYEAKPIVGMRVTKEATDWMDKKYNLIDELKTLESKDEPVSNPHKLEAVGEKEERKQFVSKVLNIWDKCENAIKQSQPSGVKESQSKESLEFFRTFIRVRKKLCNDSDTHTYSLEEAIRKTFDQYASQQPKTEPLQGGERDFKCSKCGKVFNNFDALAWHKTYKGECLNKQAEQPKEVERTEQVSAETMDLQQYVTNLLYYAHDETHSMHSSDFDRWVEFNIKQLTQYAQSHPIELRKELIDCIEYILEMGIGQLLKTYNKESTIDEYLKSRPESKAVTDKEKEL